MKKVKNDLLKILEIDPINYGKIIEFKNEIYILMDRVVHNFPGKVPSFKLENKQHIILEKFIIYYQHEKLDIVTWRIEDPITNKYWAIKIKVPRKFIEVEDDDLIKEVEVSIKYNEKLKLYYFYLETDTHFYKVFDFQETEYEIFQDRNYRNKFSSIIEGDQYMIKTGYVLKTICKNLEIFPKVPFLYR